MSPALTKEGGVSRVGLRRMAEGVSLAAAQSLAGNLQQTFSYKDLGLEGPEKYLQGEIEN